MNKNWSKLSQPKICGRRDQHLVYTRLNSTTQERVSAVDWRSGGTVEEHETWKVEFALFARSKVDRVVRTR